MVGGGREWFRPLGVWSFAVGAKAPATLPAQPGSYALQWFIHRAPFCGVVGVSMTLFCMLWLTVRFG